MFLDCFGIRGANKVKSEPVDDTPNGGSSSVPIQADRPAVAIQPDRPVGALGNIHAASIDEYAAPPLHAVHDTLRTTLSHIIESSEFADFLKRVTHSEEIVTDALENIRSMLGQTIQNKTIDTLQGWVDLGVEVSNQLNGGLAPGDSGTEFLRTLLASTGVQDSFEESGTADAFAARQRLREDAWSDMTQTMSKQVALMGFMAELASVPSLVRNLQLNDVVDSLANNARSREQFTGDVNIAKRFELEPDIDAPLLREYLAAVKAPLDADIPAYNRSAENLPGLISTELKSIPIAAIRTFSECVHGDNSHLAIAVNDELRESIKGLVPTPEQCDHLDDELDIDNFMQTATNFDKAVRELREYCDITDKYMPRDYMQNADVTEAENLLGLIRQNNQQERCQRDSSYNHVVAIEDKARFQGGMSYEDAKTIRERTSERLAIEKPIASRSADLAENLANVLKNNHSPITGNMVDTIITRVNAVRAAAEEIDLEQT